MGIQRPNFKWEDFALYSMWVDYCGNRCVVVDHKTYRADNERYIVFYNYGTDAIHYNEPDGYCDSNESYTIQKRYISGEVFINVYESRNGFWYTTSKTEEDAKTVSVGDAKLVCRFSHKWDNADSLWCKP